MTFDIQEHARSAQAELHDALAALAHARTVYESDAGPRFAQAKAAQELLADKIKSAEEEAGSASEAFHKAFSAAGFEPDETTRVALNRKNDAQAMAEGVRVAQAKGVQGLQEVAAEASTQARAYAAAYEHAYIAHAQAEAYKALQDAGEQLARAMALAAHAPCNTSVHEDSLGRPAPTPAIHDATVAGRWAFILNGLRAMAKDRPEYRTRPQVQALGLFDLGALTAQDVLTPVQIYKMQRSGEA